MKIVTGWQWEGLLIHTLVTCHEKVGLSSTFLPVATYSPFRQENPQDTFKLLENKTIPRLTWISRKKKKMINTSPLVMVMLFSIINTIRLRRILAFPQRNAVALIKNTITKLIKILAIGSQNTLDLKGRQFQVRRGKTVLKSIVLKIRKHQAKDADHWSPKLVPQLGPALISTHRNLALKETSKMLSTISTALRLSKDSLRHSTKIPNLIISVHVTFTTVVVTISTSMALHPMQTTFNSLTL